MAAPDPVDLFSRKLRGLNYSPATVTLYVSTIGVFSEYLTNRGKSLMMADAEDLNAFRDYLMLDRKSRSGEAYSPATVNCHLKAASTFFELVRGYRVKVRGPRMGKSSPEWLEEEDVRKLYGCIEDEEHRVWFTLTYEYALRVTESISLAIPDVKFSQKLLYLRAAKGAVGEPEVMPLLDSHIPMLKRWIAERNMREESAYAKTDWLFPYFLSGDSGNPYRKKAWDYLKALAKKAHIKGDLVYPHVLRHSKAVHLRLAGVSLEDLRDFLRHERFDTTLIYATITPKALGKKLGEIASPLMGMALA